MVTATCGYRALVGSNEQPAGRAEGAARLRLRPHDELSFRTGHELMAADGFTFGLGLEPGMQ